MQTVLSTVLIDVPQAAVIWLALIAVVGVALAVLLLRPGLLRLPRPGALRLDVAHRIREAAMPGRLAEVEEERERERYAEEVAVAADRARTTAERRRAEWLAVQEEVEAEWQAYQAAEEDVRRLTTSAGMPLPETVRTPAEYADRERYLHRTALDAYWARELSVEQLSDVFAHRNGWDPRLHPVEQELFLRRAVRDNLLARHEAAHLREQAAWRTAELARAAARSLRAEAVAATEPAPVPEQSVLPLTEKTAEMPLITPATRRSAAPAF